MKNQLHSAVLLLALLFSPVYLFPCTIFSGRDAKGNVWFGNNEDDSFTFKNYINVFPKTQDTKFGYYTLSKNSPENGENDQVAGGMNEAGLMYDFNSTQQYPVKDWEHKKEFPKGDKAILNHILANFETVEEVVQFFQIYWFQRGFRSAQMHLADRFGHFAIISPTGNQILTKETFQVSTNFDICSNADGSTCWRYPIVQRILKSQQPGLESFTEICKKTTQGRHTIYSSVSNLKTGDMTFFFCGDYTNSYKTNIRQLLQKGRRSYLIGDLIPKNPISQVYNTYQSKGSDAAFKRYQQLQLSADAKNIVLPNMLEYFTTEINNYDVYPFVAEFITSKDADFDLWLIKATIEVQKGDIGKAKQTIASCIEKYPQQKDLTTRFFNRVTGDFEADANATFVLKGYQNAKFVIVKAIYPGNNFYPLNNLTFMTKQDGNWVTKFKLPKGVYNYKFIVDGKEVADSSSPVKI